MCETFVIYPPRPLASGRVDSNLVVIPNSFRARTCVRACRFGLENGGKSRIQSKRTSDSNSPHRDLSACKFPAQTDSTSSRFHELFKNLVCKILVLSRFSQFFPFADQIFHYQTIPHIKRLRMHQKSSQSDGFSVLLYPKNCAK